MKALLLTATMLCGLATTAQAAVTYTLVNQQYNAAAQAAVGATGRLLRLRLLEEVELEVSVATAHNVRGTEAL